MWLDNLQWEEPLPIRFQHEWNQQHQTNPQLSQIKINRSVICSNASASWILRQHWTSLRSLYLNVLHRCQQEDVLWTSGSTSKVAQLKQLTIRRLELCAATQLSNLYNKAIHALNLTANDSFLWTGSSIVLAWMQSTPNKWKTFVGNRIALIQNETASATWRHVPTHSNPADLISRGIEPTTLSKATLWWKGTQWLTKEPPGWPTTEVNSPTETWK